MNARYIGVEKKVSCGGTDLIFPRIQLSLVEKAVRDVYFLRDGNDDDHLHIFTTDCLRKDLSCGREI